jgi:hypothetical protein
LRRGLLGIAAATSVAVVAPAAASAAITPSLALTPNSVTAGATNASIKFDIKTNTADTFKDVTTILPPGLLANAALNGGLCLISPSTQAACQVGTGMLNGAIPVSLYLVQPPHAADAAGVALCAGTTPCGSPLAVGDVTVRPASDPNGSGLNLAFTNLTAGTTEEALTFTGLRTPTYCPTTPANVIVNADSQADSTMKTAMAALTVTGCSSLQYHPSISTKVIKDSGGSGAEVISTTSQPNAATESATKTLQLGIPSSLTPNVAALASCFVTPCTVGSAQGASPIVPSPALTNGTVKIGGTITAPKLTISFPAVNLTLTGTFNSTYTAVTFANLPDTPLQGLVVDITGTAAGRAFNTTCVPMNASATFTPWDGKPAITSSAPIAYQNCPSGGGKPGAPTVSGGSISGLASGHPTLHLKVTHGSGAPNIKSVAIGPSQGLSFRKCVKSGKKHTCAGLSVSGGTVKSVKLSGGRLMITLSSPASSVSVTASGPLLTESKSLQNMVKKHKVKKLTFTIKIVDAAGKNTTLSLKLPA